MDGFGGNGMHRLGNERPVIFLPQTLRYADTGSFMGLHSRYEEAIYAQTLFEAYEAERQLREEIALHHAVLGLRDLP